jgi:TPR repeat protein
MRRTSRLALCAIALSLSPIMSHSAHAQNWGLQEADWERLSAEEIIKRTQLLSRRDELLKIVKGESNEANDKGEVVDVDIKLQQKAAFVLALGHMKKIWGEPDQHEFIMVLSKGMQPSRNREINSLFQRTIDDAFGSKDAWGLQLARNGNENSSELLLSLSVMQSLTSSFIRVPKAPNGKSWLQSLADEGNIYGLKWHAIYLNIMSTGDKSLKKSAFDAKVRAAEAGVSSEIEMVGNAYRDGDGVKKSLPLAVAWYERFVAKGYTDGYEKIGNLYRYADKPFHDDAKALEWYKKGAEAGSVKAMDALASVYGEAGDVSQQIAWLEKSIAAGSEGGTGTLASLYRSLDNLSGKEAEALKWNKIAGEKGDHTANTWLGNQYYFGKIIKKNDVEAARYWELATSGDYPSAEALGSLGLSYQYGEGVPKNPAKAIELYQKAIEGSQDRRAMYLMGMVAWQGLTDKPDYTVAIDWFKKSVAPEEIPTENGGSTNLPVSYEQGQAMNMLGSAYLHGKGVTVDHAQAKAWFEKAAESGNGQAMFWLGYMAEKGIGGTKDDFLAFDWYSKSAAKGNLAGMDYLAAAYEAGRGIESDAALAFEWRKKGADAGDSDQYNLVGWAYLNALGVEKDFSQAAKWFQKGADANITASMLNLGAMYRDGQGVAKDGKQALDWFKKAADAKDARGFLHIGWMYANGNGVTKDRALARSWFQKAASANVDGSREALAYLDKQDAREAAAKAQQLADAQARAERAAKAIVKAGSKPNDATIANALAYERTTFGNNVLLADDLVSQRDWAFGVEQVRFRYTVSGSNCLAVKSGWKCTYSLAVTMEKAPDGFVALAWNLANIFSKADQNIYGSRSDTFEWKNGRLRARAYRSELVSDFNRRNAPNSSIDAASREMEETQKRMQQEYQRAACERNNVWADMAGALQTPCF